jgi:hypothetical protein
MKNKLLVAAVVLVGLASVAYAAFTQTLTINGTGNTTGDWDVRITGITRTTADGTNGATNVSAPTFNTTSATFAVNLAYPGATATYDIALENQGNVNAVLSSISGLTEANAAVPTYIDYTLTGVAVNDTLNASATDTATLKVEWDPTDTTSNPAATKTATITLNYTQAP